MTCFPERAGKMLSIRDNLPPQKVFFLAMCGIDFSLLKEKANGIT